MQLFVKTYMGGDTFTLGAKPSDTVSSLKKKIQDEHGIPCSHQNRLILNLTRLSCLSYPPARHQVLQDNLTPSDYNIQKDSTLFLMSPHHKTISELLVDDVRDYFRQEGVPNNMNPLRRESAGMGIFVKTTSGETIAIHVKPSDTIRDVKMKIHGKHGIDADQHGLALPDCDDVLTEFLTLSHYNIQKNSTLRLRQLASFDLEQPKSPNQNDAAQSILEQPKSPKQNDAAQSSRSGDENSLETLAKLVTDYCAVHQPESSVRFDPRNGTVLPN
mmetsp:Transcript_44179/g.92877  ORF Transcript_44179/g.92877 Transcript_44179/m.92877 type:complete len:273 (+) Transcript_44179:180-998(+)